MKKISVAAIAFVMLFFVFSMNAFSINEDYLLKVNEMLDINISQDEIVYFKFVPQYKGEYSFFSESRADTFGRFYDENENLLIYNDDNGKDGNFLFKYLLEENKSYYLSVSLSEYRFIESENIKVGVKLIERVCDHKNRLNVPALEPKCEFDGYTEGVYCKDCDIYVSGHNRLIATGHNIISRKGKDATCTQSGFTDYKLCTACEFTTYEEIPAKGHIEIEDAAVSATCLKEGLTKGMHCERCREITVVQYKISVAKHSFTDYKINKKPTYLSDSTKIAYCNYGCGKSNIITEKGTKLILGKPASVKVSQTTSTIKLDWSSVKGAVGYRVYQKTDKGWKNLGTVKRLWGKITKLKSGTKYTFAVRAYTMENSKAVWSSVYTVVNTATKCSAPSKVISSQDSSSVELSWAKVSDAMGYRIYYRSGGKWKVALSSTAKRKHIFRNLKSGREFIFAIRPYIITDSGVVWGEYTVHYTATLPTTPVLKVTTPSKGKVNVSWSKSEKADGYKLYYKVGKGKYKLYKTYSSPVKLSFNLGSGKKYTFAVRAYRTVGGKNYNSAYKPISITVK